LRMSGRMTRSYKDRLARMRARGNLDRKRTFISLLL